MIHQLTRMVRPWFKGEGFPDHIYADCEVLEDQLEALDGEPVEGLGWLDPEGSDVCQACLDRWRNR
jgi:hypothetical protein